MVCKVRICLLAHQELASFLSTMGKGICSGLIEQCEIACLDHCDRWTWQATVNSRSPPKQTFKTTKFSLFVTHFIRIRF